MGENFSELPQYDFGERKVWRICLNRLVLDEKICRILVWQNTVHPPNLPNFPAIRYMIYIGSVRDLQSMKAFEYAIFRMI